MGKEMTIAASDSGEIDARVVDSCVGMSDSRSFCIVLGLDDTIVVANTIKSFDDRIRALQTCLIRKGIVKDHVKDQAIMKQCKENDSSIRAEINNYLKDQAMLKQYKDNNSVFDNGNEYIAQYEEVPGSDPPLVRPVIRLLEKNIVLTRINPEVRDTSVLVRLRPAWDNLKSYLMAQGQQFEVYICTRAKSDYASEMWRLLDPDADLIGSKQLVDRIVCVKPGAKKSLLNVWKDGKCHPKIAMIIDDRLKVWDDKDQHRVLVVPAFTPYCAPHAHTAIGNADRALCVAKNVACNVVGEFLKEFDENFLRSISQMFYEDEVGNLPCAFDVTNFLMSKMSKDIWNGRRVGLIYDERMVKHRYLGKYLHPEDPNRITSIWEKFQLNHIHRRCVIVNAEEAMDEHVALVHKKDQIDLIKNTTCKELAERRKKIAKEFDLYFNKGSSEAAYVAAGSVIKVAKKVAKRELDSAFAVVRPPGHHAEGDQSMGFCLLNNVGIATSYLLDQSPKLGIKKILIVDWDVHHGNGTQKMFYEDRRVLFFSVHRHEANFYPETEDGSHEKIGEGPGKGYNVNVPWNKAGIGNDDYYAVWDHILIPVAKEFGPDLIIVSAGFDAAAGDPLGGCLVTPHGFSVLLKKLMELAEGRIVMALEGGYNCASLSNSALACVKVLLGDNVITSTSKKCQSESTRKVIQSVSKELCPYWPILERNLPKELPSRKAPQSSRSEGVWDPNLPKEKVLKDFPEPGLKLEVDLLNASHSMATMPTAILDPGFYRSMIEVLATKTDFDEVGDVVSNEGDSGGLAAIKNAAKIAGHNKCLEFVGKNNCVDLQKSDFEAFIESEVARLKILLPPAS